MLNINFVDAEIIKDDTGYLVSNNGITGTSLEVLSFIVGGIEQSQNFNDGIDGRSRLFQGSEDKYRKITLNIRANAEYLQRVAHLRDAVNDLFSGEYYIREMRIKAAEVAYESPGEKSGDMNLGESEYVNGKQFKVTKVNAIETDDLLQSNFTVELETTDLPYAESIYTTRELHDTGYDAAVAKYGLVDNIDVDKVQYVFPGNDNNNRIPMESSAWESGSFYSTGSNNNNSTDIRTAEYITVTKGATITVSNSSETNIRTMGVYEWDGSTYIGVTWVGIGDAKTFAASGDLIKIALFPTDGTSLSTSVVNNTGTRIKLEYGSENTLDNDRFTVWNAGNVTVEPESMYLNIFSGATYTSGNFTIHNKTTGEKIILERSSDGSHFRVSGMNFSLGGIANVLRDTNREFIRLVPGNNEFEVLNGTFEYMRVDFKFYYR